MRRIAITAAVSTAVLLALLFAAAGDAIAVCVPSAYSVTGSAPPPSANWTDTSGLWVPTGGFPGCAPGDSASDTNASPTTVIVNTTIPNPITGLNFACSGCVIDIQSGGGLTLAGVGSIGSGVTLKMSGGTLTIANGGTLTFQSGSVFQFNSGMVGIQTGGQVTVAGSSNIGGTIQLSGGTLTIPAAAILNFAGGSNLTLNGGTINGGGTINNGGTVGANPAGTFTVNATLNNTSGGNVNVNGGTLSLAGGGTGDAPFSIFPGATLDFPSTTYTMTPNGSVSGGGTLQVSGGTLSIGGVTSPGGFNMSAGTLTGNGFLTIGNTFDWSGGTLTGGGGTQLAGAGIGSLTATNGNLVLDGRSFDDYGSIAYTATSNSLTLNNGAVFSVYGNFDILTDGSINTTAGAGTLNINPNGVLSKSGGSGTSFINVNNANNASVFGSSGTLDFAGTGSHTGLFDAINGGTLAFGGTNTFASGFIGSDSTGTISFPSGTASMQAGYAVDGLTSITGGTLSIEAPATTVRYLQATGGKLQLSSPFTMTGTGTLSCGMISGTSTFEVALGATLTIDSANSTPTISGIELLNNGTINYTATTISGNFLKTAAALITNNGLFDIKTDQPITEGVIITFGLARTKAAASHGRIVRPDAPLISLIVNNGTFQKSLGSGTTNIDPAFSNTATTKALIGTMKFNASYTQSAGTTTLGAGNITVATPMQLNGGTLAGAGTITGDVNNAAAIVSPGGASAVGTINITGNYTQGSSGIFNVELASAGSYDILAATGTSTLSGTLNVTLLGGYQPANGTTFIPHTFASKSGDFSVKNLPTWAGGNGSMTSSYTPISLVLTAVVTAQADLKITKTGPASATAGQNFTYTVVVTNMGPSASTGVQVSDPTPANLTFVSNSGACSTPYPCNLGTLPAGQSATIMSTYTTSPAFAGNVTNTATVSSTGTNDPDTTNNTSSANTTITPATTADVSIKKIAPAGVTTGAMADFEIDVYNNGPGVATNVTVNDPTPPGMTFVSNSLACTTPFPCTLGSLTPGTLRVIVARYSIAATPGTTITNIATVSASSPDPDLTNNTAKASVTVSNCLAVPPQLLTPADGATTGSPVVLTWTGVANATNYTVTITGASGPPLVINTTLTSASATLPPGNYSWNVKANSIAGCPPLTSSTFGFTVCNVPDAPLASVVGETTTGQTFSVAWSTVGDTTAYELQEAGDVNFSNPTSFIVNGTSRSFTKTAASPTAFFYRVRAISCAPAPFSPTISVVIIPVPGPRDPRFNIPVPNGSTTPVTFQIFIPGLPGGSTSFIASADKPWIAVLPTAGFVPPDGTLLNISLDPSSLVNGTWTGTILVVYNTPGASSRIEANGTSTSSIPVSISLVTPITPGKLPDPTPNTLVIPTVGHLLGIDSQWQSDIRIANLTSSKANYLVTFNFGATDTKTPVKQTNLGIDPGATIALDDVVKSWFGIGSMNDSANGLLYVQALDNAGRVLSHAVVNDVSINKTVAVSSRTYNTSANANSPGTLGQFVPANVFSSFIGKAGGSAPTALTLQQIAQNDAFRTNLGLVEAAGKAVSLKVGVFDAAGSKLLDFPVLLAAGQQKQLNSFLAQNNITLTNGRVQVEVADGDGRAQTYASVIDAKSRDPFLVSGTPLGGVASNFVIPAVGDLVTGNATWRSDVRIFNAGTAPLTATLTYYPNGNPSNSASMDVSLNPGEVKGLDGIVQSLFGLTNTSGALHVTTPTDAPLVVTARTFDQTPDGTLGQFIPAVTNADAVGRNDRALHILQAEESVHYRTNLGVAEVTGKPATVEVSVFLPDSKVIPRVTITLGANESRQLPILSSLGIGATYNARLAVRVTDGDGKVTAYGSVVDQTTQAPTYIPAQ